MPTTGFADDLAATREAPRGATAGRPRRRWLGSAALVVVLGAVVALTGCQVQNTPTGYVTTEQGTVVQTNFVAACTGNIPSDAGTTTSLAPTSKCECQYKVFVGSVPFNDAERSNPTYAGYPADSPTFETTEKDLAKDPNAITNLPDGIETKLKDCGSSQAVSPG